MKKVFFILLPFLIFSCGFAQRPLKGIGEWDFYVPYSKGVAVAKADNLIFTAAELGLFSYDINSGEIELYHKANFLSDIDIVDIAYSNSLKTLAILYSNGNLDILKDNTFYNFGEIERKQIVGIKRANSLNIYENYALISTTFGLVVFDLEKLEVKETYSSLDLDGSVLEVNSSLVLNDSLYLATNKGLLQGDFSGESNLLDFNNWKNIYSTSNPIKSVENLDESLWMLTSDSIIIAKENNSFAVDSSFDKVTKLFSNDNNLYFIDSLGATEFDGTTKNVIPNTSSSITGIIKEQNGSFWISDLNAGLLKIEGETKERLTPNGPVNSSIFNISYSNDIMYVTSGGYSKNSVQLFRPFVVGQLNSDGWYTKGYWSNSILDSINNINMVLNDGNGSIFYASHTQGLVEFKDDDYILFDKSNSNLSEEKITGDVRVTSLAKDSENNIWVTNHFAQNNNSIHKISGTGEWESFSFNSTSKSNTPLRIYIDDNDLKWVTLGSTVGGNGVLVFDEKNEQERVLTKGFLNGDLAENKVSDIAFDSDGSVWMVGRAGVSVIQNPISIFDGGEENEATKPIFEGRPLMENEFCTAIEIDGGSRKWIGTENGLFLMDENGTSLIANYNTENSPLPTNKINDLELHPKTGELFIGTDFGLLSLRTNSSDGNGACKGQVKVFPNPVTKNFDGEVGISGLTEDAEVKITDAWGNLVYSTKANGGTASWNLKDYNNVDAQNGVYTILVNGKGRKQSCSENLAIIK